MDACSVATFCRCMSLQPPKADQVVEAQRMRIVQMLLKGKTYGLPGSDGKVKLLVVSRFSSRVPFRLEFTTSREQQRMPKDSANVLDQLRSIALVLNLTVDEYYARFTIQIRVKAEMGQLPRVGKKSTPRIEHVFRS